uniref:AAA+ ATPase domain-containing protein n=1 Tax=Leersia perrieri TaxID=77586 RepID=A0A0D9X9D0_9ORYZ
MAEEQKSRSFLDVPKDIPIATTKPLTIRTNAGGGCSSGSISDRSNPISPAISLTPHLYSPSPPSSAFVSALQSPYISPRALDPPTPRPPAPAPVAVPSPPACYSNSEDTDAAPSASRTPPSERYDSGGGGGIDAAKVSDAGGVVQPRVSFSFPVPRVSFTRGSVASPASNAKLRSCDVYIGYHGNGGSLGRFCKWLKSELELQGVASFVADRAKYSDTQSHEIADRIICSVVFGVIVVTMSSFLNPFSLEEIRFFAQKKNLVPILFETEPPEIAGLFDGKLEDKEGKEAFEGLMRCHEFKLEANETNWRSCVSKTVMLLRSKLGRKSIAEKESEGPEGMPFPRNRHFVGREKELSEIEGLFFGSTVDIQEVDCPRGSAANDRSSGMSDGFADEESDTVRTSNARYISLEMRKCKEPTLEAWIDPVIELSGKGRNLQKQRSKHRRSRFRCNSKGYGSASVVCISGSSGIGKTELALEFAYRYSQRYKMVLWIGGEARYLRQNILNLSMNLGLDISAEAEKERGRIRSFEEQELDAFQRVKRELFRDVPYLLVIDNLESERDWWEGKDLHDFIPRNTGATHVIVTTRLPRVINLEPMQLPQLSYNDAMILIKGKQKNDYPPEEMEVLRKLDERLGRLSFGLWVVGSLLSELMITPSTLFEAVDRISLNESLFPLGANDDGFCRNNSFLIKVLVFCFALMDRAKGGSLTSKMIIAGSWLAPAPVSSTLLAATASKLPMKGSMHLLGESLKTAFLCGTHCFLAPHGRKAEVESALLLVKLGLARKATRHPGCWIQFHPITQLFGKIRGGLAPTTAAVNGVMRAGNPSVYSDHLWASAFLVFGFKSEPPSVQLKAVDMVLFIRKTALPLAIDSFMTFSRCGSALELLKVCTNVLEEVEKSYASRIQDLNRGSLCWRKKLQPNHRVDEFVWQEVTLLKATLLETRAKLLLRGGLFDTGEELCRTCISIRTVMLGHGHAHTLAAQETLAKLVRYRSKI